MGAAPNSLARFEGASPSLEQVMGGIPAATPYKWNDRNLLISPLQFKSQNFGPFNFGAGANGLANPGPMTLPGVVSKRGGLWLVAFTMVVIGADNSLKLVLNYANVALSVANSDGSGSTPLLYPNICALSALGSLVTNTIPSQLPFQSPPMPAVLSDAFQALPNPVTTGQFNFQLSGNVFVNNTDGAAGHNITTITLAAWYRTLEGLEP